MDGFDGTTLGERARKMTRLKVRMVSASFALAMLALSAPVATDVRAQTSRVDQAATQILKRTTDYLGGLRQFSVRTQNTLEDLLDSGQRVDRDFAASLPISRPNKLHVCRRAAHVRPVYEPGRAEQTLVVRCQERRVPRTGRNEMTRAIAEPK